MMCAKPYVDSAGRAFGCGQCMPCRFNTRRLWTHRILLEAAQYSDNAFVTLTYRPEDVPAGGTLVPDHPRDWLKRLRGRIEPLRIRYYLVGEYGDESDRPHYHAALFGFASCRFGMSRYSKLRDRCCDRCELVRDTWGHGNVFLGSLEPRSAGYLARYVSKKMTNAGDPRLNGRYKEFGRMSLRPGIGHAAMWDIASVLMQHGLDAGDDVPESLRHGMKKFPLGRYLRRELRKMVGKDGKAPQSVLDKMAAEMRPLQLAARGSKTNPSVRGQLVASTAGRRASFEARTRIFNRKGKL